MFHLLRLVYHVFLLQCLSHHKYPKPGLQSFLHYNQIFRHHLQRSQHSSEQSETQKGECLIKNHRFQDFRAASLTLRQEADFVTLRFAGNHSFAHLLMPWVINHDDLEAAHRHRAAQAPTWPPQIDCDRCGSA